MKVFLDTNVLVSAFATRGLCADLVRYVLSEHELCTGEVNLQELNRVLKGRLRVPAKTVSAVEQLLREQTVVPKPKKKLEVAVRDAADAWVLASAVAASVDVLVTGDRDLLDIADQCPLPVITPRAFWERARKGRRSRK